MLFGRNILAAAVFSLAISAANVALAEDTASQSPHLVMNQASKISPILGAATSEKNLIGYFGAKNVKRQKVGLGEGETADGTVIFPNDAKRRASFVWKNTKKRDLPETIFVCDTPSLWRLPNEITTGTTLIELEKMNGKPFKMSGFDWDYGGNVLSWNGGKLESALKSKSGKVSATLQLVPTSKQYPDELSGDKEILSSNANMRKLNPAVGTVNILAP
ncbi:MAG: hypothetical protein HYX67_12185 [Candidatus Melainabacteria bacterium]|nr:hypothetical protein [Candidatus Melainabacteria bacterium]